MFKNQNAFCINFFLKKINAFNRIFAGKIQH